MIPRHPIYAVTKKALLIVMRYTKIHSSCDVIKEVATFIVILTYYLIGGQVRIH